MAKIHIFLTDQQVLFREGMHFALSAEEEFEVIGESTSNQETLNLIRNDPPRIAILNTSGDNPGGIDVTRYLKRQLTSLAIILVMDSHNTDRLFSVIKSGASACLSKDIDPEDFIGITKKVARGKCPISQELLRPEIASLAINEFEDLSSKNKENGNLLTRLLPAEAEILRHISAGSPLEETSKALSTSERTIRRHLDFILGKLTTNEYKRLD
jgi:DNA-binding NarL/FixJ family response regulator